MVNIPSEVTSINQIIQANKKLDKLSRFNKSVSATLFFSVLLLFFSLMFLSFESAGGASSLLSILAVFSLIVVALAVIAAIGVRITYRKILRSIFQEIDHHCQLINQKYDNVTFSLVYKSAAAGRSVGSVLAPVRTDATPKSNGRHQDASVVRDVFEAAVLGLKNCTRSFDEFIMSYPHLLIQRNKSRSDSQLQSQSSMSAIAQSGDNDRISDEDDFTSSSSSSSSSSSQQRKSKRVFCIHCGTQCIQPALRSLEETITCAACNRAVPLPAKYYSKSGSSSNQKPSTPEVSQHDSIVIDFTKVAA
jgi:hypothetical protein